MAKSDTSPPPSPGTPAEKGTAAYLDMPPERRAAAQANAAMLLATAQRVADELPLGTDVDDFRRVLVEEA